MKDNELLEKREIENSDLLKIIDAYKEDIDILREVLHIRITEDMYNYFDKLFNQFISKRIELTNKEKKELLKSVEYSCPNFFEDEINTIFLKLINLYNKNLKINGEDQELYYIADHFSPNSNDTHNISKRLQSALEWLKGYDFFEYILGNDEFDSILKPYKEVKEKIELNEIKLNESELQDLLRIFDTVIESYENKNNLIEIFSNNDFTYKPKYLESLLECNLNGLAKIYCEINGNNFTHDEKHILINELSKEERILLSKVLLTKELSQTKRRNKIRKISN